MTRNEEYWDKTRIPKLQKMIVMPMPEATTRLAALRSGQVDWIEVPPPDAIPSLQAAGFTISLWPYPHTYPYVLNTLPTSPFNDVRVRQAANYAIDRQGQGAVEGRWLWVRQAAEGEDHDLHLRFRADAADPDERVHAAELQGRRDGYRV